MSDTRIAAAVAAARPGCRVTLELDRSAVAGANGRTIHERAVANGLMRTGETSTSPKSAATAPSMTTLMSVANSIGSVAIRSTHPTATHTL